ncbi:MAG TPA: hypothetical protein VIK91_27190, partial [Nannocystis sp.]
GWPVAWTNRVELTGTGGGSWIGQDAGEADRVVVLGLEPPATIRLATGILDSGMLINDGAEFVLVDRDGHLVAFAQDEPGELLYERLAPGDDPAPASLVGAGGNFVDLHGRHVNAEAIGPAGERRRWQILPGGSLPGLDHAAIDTDAGRTTLRPASVRDAARWLEGRPCALYLIRRDTDDGTWPAWSAQHASGYSLIWWGTVKSLRADGHVWRLGCDGPSSWLRKTLNANRPAEWQRFFPLLELAPGQDLIAATFFYRDAPGAIPVRCGTSAYDPVDDVVTGGQTPAQLALQIHTRLQTLVAAPGLDDAFDNYAGGKFRFDDQAVEIKVDDNVKGNGYAWGGVCMLRMHQLVWLHLGWDLSFAVQGRKSKEDLESEYEVKAIHGASFNPAYNFETPDPAPGYWTAVFTTWPLGIGDGHDDPMRVDNDGAWRLYRPAYPGGGVAVVSSEAQQTWDIALGGVDAPYLEGQLAKPPADKTLGSGTCDAAGFFAVRGSRASEVDGEVETVYQLARVSWVDDDDRVALDANSRALVWAEEWLDPAAYGSASEKLSGPWAANDLEFVPVALIGGYNLKDGDHAHRVLARLLLSTGTAQWSGVGDTATISPGANAHPDAGGGPADDLEIADLGLGIPASMVDLWSFRASAEALPQGIDGPLNRTRLAAIGPFDSQQLIEVLIKPRGWCFSLDGGRYGLFARSEPLAAEDVQVVITPA